MEQQLPEVGKVAIKIEKSVNRFETWLKQPNLFPAG